MNSIRILIPSIGHPTRPSLIQALRDNGERSIEVIGVDMDSDGIGPHIADSFYQVPPRTNSNYLERIIEICEVAGVDIYYALGEEEAIASSERIRDFEAIGVSVITPGTPEMLRIATNKARYHQFFQASGIPYAQFRVINRFEDLERGIRELGYPDLDVFLKPSVSRGGRGARLVTNRNLSTNSLEARSADVPAQSLEAVLESLGPSKNDTVLDLIAMEYLTGTYYSVDVLSQNGKPFYVIPKIRIQGTASNTTVGEVDLNPAAMELATMACEAFQFSYLQNYEMKLDGEGRPKVYDINPRGGTSLILCAVAGANIAYYALKLALGEEIPQNFVKDRVKMLRYYGEIFQLPD